MLSGKKRPLLVCATGGGKTVMFSYFTQSAINKGNHVLILAHRDELLEQISETLNMFHVKHGYISSGNIYRRDMPAQVGSVMTVVRRLDIIRKPDIIIVDEAHHARKNNTYDKIISYYKDSWVIGVTATPCRLSGEPLNEVFDDLVQGPQTGELIDRGYLCKYKVYAPFKIDVSKIKTRLGDYSATDLDGAINKKAITGNAVDEYIRLLSGKRAVVFCVSVEHAESVAREFSARGIPSASVDGKMNIWDRKRILAAFRDNRIKVITNCNIITEGFDLKELDAVIMLRPTQSLSLYIQMVGRALRISPGKDMAYIIDHVGNVERHGFPCDEREWSLSGTAKNKDKEVSVKTCPNCYAVVKSVVKQCAYCDYKFGGSGGGRQIEQVDGTLEEVEVKRKIASEKVIEQVKAETLEELYELGVKRGYKHARRWAQHIFNARQAKKLKGSRT